MRLTEQNKELEIRREEVDRQKRELEKKNKDLETARIEMSRAKELELANTAKNLDKDFNRVIFTRIMARQNLLPACFCRSLLPCKAACQYR